MSSVTPDVLLSGTKISLSQGQRAMANLILDVFTREGYSTSVAIAAVVNAYAESSLDAGAVGDSGHSVGLFQLHDKGGGAGMSVTARKDPRMNIARIIQELVDAERSKGPVVTRAGTAIAATRAFSTYVERPEQKQMDAARRARLCELLFPAYAATTAKSLPLIGAWGGVGLPAILPGVGGKPISGVVLLLGLGVLAAAVKRLMR